jgi:hypothetical protein
MADFTALIDADRRMRARRHLAGVGADNQVKRVLTQIVAP